MISKLVLFIAKLPTKWGDGNGTLLHMYTFWTF